MLLVALDADDPASLAITGERLILKQVVVPPGLTMGALNMAGYVESMPSTILFFQRVCMITSPRLLLAGPATIAGSSINPFHGAIL